MGPLGFEPMTYSRRDKSGAYDHSSTTVDCELRSSLRCNITAKIDNFRMAFMALGARKCKHHWSWLFLHIPIELLGPVAGRILANLTISELFRQSKAKFFITNGIFPEIQKVSSYLHSRLVAQK